LGKIGKAKVRIKRACKMKKMQKFVKNLGIIPLANHDAFLI